MRNLLLLAIVVLAGCASSKITSSWTDPSAGANRYKKIMVVSIIENEDISMRKKMEQHMVGDLKSIGYDAISFLAEFNEGDFKTLRYDSVRNRLIKKGIDGVITISLMAKEKESIYVKDKQISNSDGRPGTSFNNYYITVRQDLGKPGYYINATQFFWESNFYDVSTLALLYNVRTTSFEPASTESLAHQYGKQVIGDMQKNYVLIPR